MGELGVERAFTETMSGKNTERPQLQAMLEFVREGDTVVVESYSRLARSTRDLLDIVEGLREKKVEFVSRKEQIDTSTPTGRLLFVICAGLAQFERELLLERQREGIEQAKKAGKYKGRKPISIDTARFKTLYDAWRAGETTAVAAQRTLGISAPTWYRRVREYEDAV
jgi:DNA invertase Pin-like site-specific DNA recombinase